MTMHHYAVYETETGAVLGKGSSTNVRALVLARNGLQEGQSLYVGEIDPATTFLPGGFPAPKLADEIAVSPQDVKAHAARLLSYSDWYVTRRADTGEAMPDAIATYRQAVRDASDMSPIPADFRDPKHWPVSP